MIVPIDSEVLQAAGVAVVLAFAAAGLDRFARRAPRPMADRKAVGFRYRRELNAWQCSEGYFLWPREVDSAGRIARYRANADTCNRCVAKRYCTASTGGRELIRSLDDLPQGDQGQFRRGLSLLVLAVAAALLLLEAGRHHQPPELWLLTAALGVLTVVSRVTLRHFVKWGRYTEQPELAPRLGR